MLIIFQQNYSKLWNGTRTLKWVRRHLFGHLTLLYTTVVVSHSIGPFIQ